MLCVSLCVLVHACDMFEHARMNMTPLSIPGAEYVGAETCSTSDCHQTEQKYFHLNKHASVAIDIDEEDAEAGQAEGLSEDMALQMAKQTVFGAAALAKQAEEHPEDLRSQVTSKGGTTQAGLEAMAAGEFRTLIRDTVRAAKERSIEMGKA